MINDCGTKFIFPPATLVIDEDKGTLSNEDHLFLVKLQEWADSANDTLSWGGTSSGLFAVKSAMALVRGEVEDETASTWKAIWKVGVPQKCRNFLWLVLHEVILCNANRVRHRLASCAACVECGELLETCLHIVRDCPRAREVWSALQPPADYEDFYSWSITDWIRITQSEMWATVFSMAVWWICRWRNARAFGHPEDIPFSRYKFIMERVTDYTNVTLIKGKSYGHLTRRREERYVKWESPPDGWVKLNTDRASRGNPGSAGGGGILRSSLGAYLAGFAVKCGVCSSVRAELWAALKGLLLARDMALTRVILAVDSEVVVQELRDDPRTCNPNYFLILQCRALLVSPSWEVRVKHVYREANMAADWLANYAFVLDNSYSMFTTPPAGFFDILKDDVMGVARPRNVSVIE